jgi:glycerol-3-phosphate acyltransferase PlsY
VPVLCCFLVMAVTVALSRYVSLGSLAAAFTVGPLTAAWLGHAPQPDAALIIAVLAGRWWR